jgi:hypothetical protein
MLVDSANKKELNIHQYVLLLYFLRSLGLKTALNLAPIFWHTYTNMLMDQMAKINLTGENDELF